MDQIIPTENVAFRITVAEGSLWCLGPGVHTERIAPEDEFLDIHIGGAMSDWSDRAGAAAAASCPPNSFTYLPSGEARTVTTTRTGSTVRATFRRRALIEAAGRELPHQPVRHAFDAALLGAACIVRDHAMTTRADIGEDLARAFVSMLVLRVAYVLSGRPGDPAPKRPQPIQAALEYIEEHLGAPLRHGDIAGAVGVSPYHFARMFRLAMGMSVRQYIIARRLARAQALLVRTNDGLADIAYQAGFGSQSHMTTLFRKHLGRTPGEVRGTRG